MDKLIYICHQFGGEQKNVLQVERLIKGLIKYHPTYCFLSPLHATGFLYKELTYDKGMEYCLTLLDMCDEMWVFGEFSQSKGCLLEKEYCKQYNIPIIEKR